jgi:circadian clock protein KaiC
MTRMTTGVAGLDVILGGGLETTILGPSPEPVGGTSFLFHNLILMRYIEQNSETGRALNIVKMRNSRHSRHVHHFDIDDQGTTVGSILQEVTGTLGWSALRAPATAQRRPSAWGT